MIDIRVESLIAKIESKIRWIESDEFIQRHPEQHAYWSARVDELERELDSLLETGR